MTGCGFVIPTPLRPKPTGLNRPGRELLFFGDRAGDADQVREAVSCWPGRPPHQRILLRWADSQRVEQGETKGFCSHETYLANSGYLERLTIGQRRWGDCDGQLEARVYYPPGWQQPSAIWLTSRSEISQWGDYWFELPNLSLLVVRDYNFLRGLFEQRLLQVDYDRGEEITRLLTVEKQSISKAWGCQAKTLRPAPKIEPWGFGDNFWPPHQEEKLRSFAFGAERVSSLETETALDGIADCQRIVEAIRVQAENGPVNLNRLARDTGLLG